MRSTGEEEEEEDEDEAGNRHDVARQEEEQEERGEDLPAPRRRRGVASREIRSLDDYNSSGPSFAAVRGNIVYSHRINLRYLPWTINCYFLGQLRRMV